MKKLWGTLTLSIFLLCGCQMEQLPADGTAAASVKPFMEQIITMSPEPIAATEPRKTEFTVGDHVVRLELDDERDLFCGLVYSADNLTNSVQIFTSDTKPPFLETYVEDVNFDGEDDFYYLYSRGAANNYYVFWVWDSERERYVEQADLARLSLPVFNQASKTIETHARGSAAHFWDAIYGYVDGDLTLLRSLNMGGDWQTQEMTVTNYIEGHLGLLYSATVPMDENWDDPAYDAFMKFYDLDYWGEDDKDYHPPEKTLLAREEYAVGDYTVRLSLFPQEHPPKWGEGPSPGGSHMAYRSAGYAYSDLYRGAGPGDLS